MKKLFSFIVLLIVFLTIFSFTFSSALADGMVIEPQPYSDKWNYSDEGNQQAYINYDNGWEKMIISIGINGKNNKGAFWLFPVPANPDDVKIDVVKELPDFRGDEISGKANSNLEDTIKILQLTQLYTIPFVSLETRAQPFNGRHASFGAGVALNNEAQSDVVVYEHLDKEGISSEIVTAKTANGLYNYLKNKGLNIETGSIPILDTYIGKNYSFIVSWINQTDQENYQAGIFVEFRTREIYFPMLPTSVYGNKIVPVTIRVIGFVSPKIFQNIKNYTKIEYYISDYSEFPDNLKNFYIGQNQNTNYKVIETREQYYGYSSVFILINHLKNLKYTKVEINAPSETLTNDLWFYNQAPIKTYYSTFIAKHPIICTIILLIISSIIAGVLAGLIIFKDLRKKPIKLGLIGLSNLFTIIGVIITTIFIGTKNKNENINTLLIQLKQKGYLWKRRVAIILLCFIAMPLLIFGLFALPSIVEDAIYSQRWFLKHDIFWIFILYILPISALIVGFSFKRIKPDDKSLFGQLKIANYSSWSFQPKDRLKIAFIPIFSVSFLIISWLLVKIIELTV